MSTQLSRAESESTHFEAVCILALSLTGSLTAKHPVSPTLKWDLFQLIFCCYGKILTKETWGRKGFTSSYRLQSVIEGSQGGSSKQEHQSGTIEGCCLLVCSQPHIQPWYPTQDHPGVMLPSSDLGLPMSINNPKTAPRDMHTGHSDLGNS